MVLILEGEEIWIMIDKGTLKVDFDNLTSSRRFLTPT